MRRDDITIVQQFQTIQEHFLSFGGEAGDKVGTDRRVRSSGLDALYRSHRVRAAVPPLHTFQDHVVARL